MVFTCQVFLAGGFALVSLGQRPMIFDTKNNTRALVVNKLNLGWRSSCSSSLSRLSSVDKVRSVRMEDGSIVISELSMTWIFSSIPARCARSHSCVNRISMVRDTTPSGICTESRLVLEVRKILPGVMQGRTDCVGDLTSLSEPGVSR